MLKTLRAAFLAFTALCLTSPAFSETTVGNWKYTQNGRYLSLGDGDVGNEWFHHFTPAADYCGRIGDRYIRMAEALRRNRDDADDRAIWWTTHTCKGKGGEPDLVRVCIDWVDLEDACSSYYYNGLHKYQHD